MKRLIIASVIAVTVVAAAAAGTAWGASGPSSAIITFDDVAQQVTLQIPDPPCDVTEPNLRVEVLPQRTQGVGGRGHHLRNLGHPHAALSGQLLRHHPGRCLCRPVDERPVGAQAGMAAPDPPTGACAPPSVPSTTDTAPASTTTTTDGGPPPAAASQPPVAPTVAAASVTPTTVTTTTVPSKTDAAVTTLPFTGTDITPLALLGLTLVTLGLCLLVRRRSRTV